MNDRNYKCTTVSCDIDSQCLDASLRGLLVRFLKLILDGVADITMQNNVQDAARVYVVAMKRPEIIYTAS